MTETLGVPLTRDEALALADLVALEKDRKPRDFPTDAAFEHHVAYWGDLLDRLLKAGQS